MSTLLLSELVRESAASNQRIAKSVDAAAQRPEEPRPSADKGVHRTKTRDAREALRYTLRQDVEVRGLWQGAVTLFEDGLEGEQARALLDVVLEAFASWFGLVKSTRDLWQTAVRAGAISEGQEELEAACQNVEKARKAAQDMRDFLSRPWPAVDPALLENARKAMAEGRYSSAEVVRARLCNQKA